MAQPLPVIAGVAQFNPRAAGLAEAPEPLAMMERVARTAAEDSGAPDILKSIDAVAVLNIVSARYHNAPDALASRLGISPARKISTTFGGNTPQYLINYFAREIAAGKIRAALIVGAEAIYTARRAAKSGGVKWNMAQGSGEPEVLGDPRMGTNAYEERYGAKLPIQVYPMFENAHRARKRWTIGEHRERFGKLCSSMTRVAAANPYAWFRKERSAAEIITATPENRIICFPYTKLMNAIMEVDLAAAVIVASDEETRRVGVPQSKTVYIHSASDATDSWLISERESFNESPTLRACSNAAIGGAGIEANQVSHFDFYSCFPVALEFAMEAVGIELGDQRGVTLTGGLPYAGGPANNYVTHSVAAMTERLRDRAGQFGMTTGLGWYFTKHAAAVYNLERPHGGFNYEVFKEPQRGSVIAIENPEGAATIETYTVEHDRAGDPSSAIVVGRLEKSGARFFARAPKEILAAMETEEFVGKRGRVRSLDGVNLFEPL
ncbi:MAG TPA: acetyl-CoA acetyltransferase [Candidatus Binataceae bacterium]|nr:acetyl-CoA acetyltransferase [Candidatus Binataceae bacterium]